MFQSLKKFFIADDTANTAEALYWEIVEVARQPKIYQKFQIPDTLDGRFDCLLVHLFLVVGRLQELNEGKLANLLLKYFIKDMDRSLRESGVGDPSISRKMRRIGEAYMGRMQKYKDTISDFDAFSESLQKNIYRGQNISSDAISLLTHYVLNYKQVLNHFVPRKPLPQAVLD